MSSLPTYSRLVDALIAHSYLKGAILFGSASRGDLRPDSDLDIAIFVDRELSGEEVLALKVLAAEVAGRDVDIVPVTPRLSYILQNEIAREGKVLFARDQEYIERFLLKAPQQYADFLITRRPLEEEYIRRKMQ